MLAHESDVPREGKEDERLDDHERGAVQRDGEEPAAARDPLGGAPESCREAGHQQRRGHQQLQEGGAGPDEVARLIVADGERARLRDRDGRRGIGELGQRHGSHAETYSAGWWRR